MMTEPLPAPVLVIHDAGAPEAGRPWRDAFTSVGWTGPVHAPDLPGHGATPAPLGGNYEMGDAVFFLLPLLQDLQGGPAPVVVGVGANGWAAQLIAVAGRASALVLVDGLGGPWTEPAAVIAAGRDRLRAIAADPAAIGAPPRSGLDPRAALGLPRFASRTTAARVVGEITVPILAFESAGSPLAADDADDLVLSPGAYARRVVRLDDVTPKGVASDVISWFAEIDPAAPEA